MGVRSIVMHLYLLKIPFSHKTLQAMTVVQYVQGIMSLLKTPVSQTIVQLIWELQSTLHQHLKLQNLFSKITTIIEFMQMNS